MISKKRSLLLIGSPKQQHSTSESLGMYLVDKLQKKGFESESLFIHKSLKPDNKRMKLLEAINKAEIVIVAFPLYIDSLPYLVIKMMELVAENRKEKKFLQEQKLICIVNNGFPESHQNNIAVAICRQFAKETGFIWFGGLQLGGGEAINGKSLNTVKGMARNVIKSLNLAADSISKGNPISQNAKTLMAKSIVPNWLYRWLGAMRWKSDAKKYETKRQLHNRPYQSK
jgi:multimeric flavodoxin WrbA